MATKVLVLGGGSGGLVAANKVKRLLGREVEVTLVDKNAYHEFMPAYPWVAFGMREPEQVRRPLANLEKEEDPHGDGEDGELKGNGDEGRPAQKGLAPGVVGIFLFLLYINGLPLAAHPAVRAKEYVRVLMDEYGIFVYATDPRFDLESTKALLRELGAEVEEVRRD